MKVEDLAGGFIKAEASNEKQFNHIPTFAKTSYKKTYASKGPNYTFSPDKNWEEFAKNDPDAEYIKEQATYYKVRAKWKDVNASLAKSDCEIITPDETDSNFQIALKFATSYLGYMWSEPNMKGPFEFALDTSAGIPGLQKGQRKKRDMFKRPDIVLDKLVDNITTNIPVISVNDKQEFLEKEDLDRGKIRMTYCPPLDFIIKQKRLFDGQNKKLLEYHENSWIKYGMSKQYLGFHKEIKKLEKFEFITESDASGWDKKAYLKWVYAIRKRNLSLSPQWESLWDYVVYHTMNPHILLPNGYIVRLLVGNISGSNNTASDNSILHLLILFHLMVYIWRKYRTDEPILSVLLEQCYFLIYSDDKLGGVNLSFFNLTAQEFFKEEVYIYSLYGMVLKPSSLVCSHRSGTERVSDKHSFLGSYCHWNERLQIYVPYPRVRKICSSIVSNPLIQLKDIEYYKRIADLVILSYPNPKIFRILLRYLNYVYMLPEMATIRWQIDEFNNSLNIDTSSRTTFEKLYAGFELSPAGVMQSKRISLRDCLTSVCAA